MVEPSEPRTGAWTLAGGRAIIDEPDGPATILVPTESVRLIAVDLPLASHARRLSALPFAIEEAIAEPLDAVHIALGEAVAPGRYLAAIVRHAAMREWVEAAEALGLADAAMVPDALMLPVPAEGEWCIEAVNGRILARAGDGTGFAMPRPMMTQAWKAAGRPRIWIVGGELPDGLSGAAWAGDGGTPGDRLARPAIDLRQGVYARRGTSGGRWLRRIGWIAAAGIVAHSVIAAADVAMLNVIAERRAADLRAAVQQAAPGTALPAGDVRVGVADLLPVGGPPRSAFLPLLTRISGALAPVSGSVTARAMRFEGDTLTIEIAPGGPDLAERVRGAVRSAGITADVAAGADGAVRIRVMR